MSVTATYNFYLKMMGKKFHNFLVVRIMGLLMFPNNYNIGRFIFIPLLLFKKILIYLRIQETLRHKNNKLLYKIRLSEEDMQPTFPRLFFHCTDS